MPNTLAIVVPTKDSATSLNQLGNSILGQTRPAERVVVVDSSDSDDTANVASALGFQVVRSNLNRVQARKRGLDEVREDFVVFVDSDQILVRSCLEELLHHALERSAAAIVPFELSDVPGRWGELLRSQDQVEYALGEGLPRFFRTEVLQRLDWAQITNGSAGHAEDRILRTLLRRQGIRAVGAGTALILHSDPPFSQFFLKQFRNTQTGTGPKFVRAYLSGATRSFLRLANPVLAKRVLRSWRRTVPYVAFFWARVLFQVAGYVNAHLRRGEGPLAAIDNSNVR